ncbi:hypothetical protein [Caldimonas brevitalea]|uniref:Uncharacterized protein n=1 Tax=Caldimonas brevitalea TaxID=413882 RepID=A0A0G3BMT2_9BURK|nr:hypothetical protein [Caldimonas brevitalea]AKJ30737.1 hypothetical protein AAW51_4046 [Caldimonas brevitalea]
MDINAEIISGESIGGVRIGECLLPAIEEARAEGFLTLEAEPAGYGLSRYYFWDGALVVVVDQGLIVKRMWCRKPYGGKYRGIFEPGMTVEDVVKASRKQLITAGVLLLDGDCGAGFDIPDEFGDYDYVEQLPQDLKLEEFHVARPYWWRLPD